MKGRYRRAAGHAAPPPTIGLMKLYNFPFGPYPQRLTIYVPEKGLTDIELIHVLLHIAEQTRHPGERA